VTYIDIIALMDSGLSASAINAIAGGGTMFTLSALVAIGLPPATANAKNAYFDMQVL
jgi:uncharacterized membrane protein YfcA